MNQLKGIIFDLDGTLANTYLDFPKMCLDADLPIGTKILEYCEGLSDPDEVLRILSIVEQHELDGAKKAEWIHDAEIILSRFCNANIPMAIVTRNMKVAAKQTIEKLGIPIELVITREDCLPKPHPQGLLKVAQQWNISSQDLIYVGDYRFDLEAANRAGMMACLLANDRNKEFHMMADKVIERFQELEVFFELQSV